MPEGDITVWYRIVPTADSIKQSADKIVSGVTKGFSKGFTETVKDASGKLKSIFGVIPGVSGLGRQISPMVEVMKTTMAGFKGARAAGAGIGGAAGAGAAAGGEAAAAMGGLVPTLMSILGGITGMVALLGIIAAATFVVSSFFEAVGPMIRLLSKILTATILILLAPILKLLLPALPGIVKAITGFAKFIANLETGLINVFLMVGGWIMKGLQFIAERLNLAFQKLFAGDVIGFFMELGKMIFDGLMAAVMAAAPLIIAGFSFLAQLAIQAFTMAFNTIAGVIDWIGTAVFGEEIWTGIKEAVNVITGIFLTGTWLAIKGAVEFIRDVIFNPKGAWEKIKQAIDFIGKNVFGTGLWGAIKQAIKDTSEAIDKEWKNIIKFLQDAGAELGPIVRFLQDIGKGFAGPATTVKNIVERMAGGAASMLGSTRQGLSSAYSMYQAKKEGDFISRPGMGITEFSPKDTIIGVSRPESLFGAKGAKGDVNITNTFNIDASVDKTELMKVLSKFAREQARELRMRTSYMGGTYA